mmetsp:Transcript_7857/g.12511  ORF Transcript_7857/g.12511 Transcript_7857/m.12511 type:complete len:287 (+) Transcript_7857:49-909(+)
MSSDLEAVLGVEAVEGLALTMQQQVKGAADGVVVAGAPPASAPHAGLTLHTQLLVRQLIAGIHTSEALMPVGDAEAASRSGDQSTSLFRHRQVVSKRSLCCPQQLVLLIPCLQEVTSRSLFAPPQIVISLFLRRTCPQQVRSKRSRHVLRSPATLADSQSAPGEELIKGPPFSLHEPVVRLAECTTLAGAGAATTPNTGFTSHFQAVSLIACSPVLAAEAGSFLLEFSAALLRSCRKLDAPWPGRLAVQFLGQMGCSSQGGKPCQPRHSQLLRCFLLLLWLLVRHR